MRPLLPWVLAAAVACGSGDADCTKEIPYDGIDQDCNGEDLVDNDGDGYVAVEAGGDDCDDSSVGIHPGVAEVPYDGFDQDCDGGDLVDADGDGHDAEVVGGDDCDDAAGDIYPGAVDPISDGIDQDCDGNDGSDADGDGWASAASGGDDCADDDATRNPGADEIWYDGIDQDCDGACDYDQDGDGAVLVGTVVADGSVCDLDPLVGVVDAVEDCDDTNPFLTSVAVASIVPADGAEEVSPSTVLVVTLSQIDPFASVLVRDDQGVVVPGVSSVAGSDIFFEATAAYEYTRTYTAEVSHGCGVEDFDFTIQTSPIPVDPTLLPGRVWEFNAADGNWTEPPGVGSILAPLLDLPMYLTVLAEGTSTLELRVAPSDSMGAQDLCVVTTEIPGADFTGNPTFDFGPVNLQADFNGIKGTLTQLTGSGTFNADASRVDNVILDGNLDTRPLVDVFAPGSAPDTICVLLLLAGTPCTPCPDGTGTYCIDVRVEDLDAIDAPTITVVERTAAEILADPVCP